MEQTRNSNISTELFDNFFQRSITADVFENDASYKVVAELAGIDKSDITIDYEDNTLTISTASTSASQQDEGTYLMRERVVTDLKRQFIFKNIESTQIKAQFDNGLLTITLPKVQNKTSITID